MLRRMSLISAALILTLVLSSCGAAVNRGADNKFDIVTSFYPVYVTVLNLTDGMDSVAVRNLTEPKIGCLHDYALTSGDVKKLETADVLVINGAGMEPFMDKLAKNNPKLKVINASQNVETIKKNGEENPHVWLSISDLIKQVEAITIDLCAQNPVNAEKYKKNAETYINKLKTIRNEYQIAFKDVKGRNIVTFHEAFEYLARDFGFTVVTAFDHDENEALSPVQITELIDLVKKNNIKSLFSESLQSASIVSAIAKETGAKVYALDLISSGNLDGTTKDAYLSRMSENLNTIKKAE